MNAWIVLKTPQRQWRLWGTGALLLACGLGSQATLAADPKPAAAAPVKPALTVTTVQAMVRSIPSVLSANGNVLAWQEASVGAEVGGLRVQELHAQVGDTVQRGQLLASLVSDGVQADVALARAQLAEAQALGADAVANAERARSLQDSGAISAQQIAQMLTAEQAAKARMESAKAGLDAQLLRLKHTQVLAPDSGTITQRNAALGTVVGAGSEMFRMIRQGRLEWRAELTSAELGRVPVGSSVVVNAPGGVQATGRVRMVAPTVDPQTRLGLVYVDLVAPVAPAKVSLAAAFKPGMYAQGSFALGKSDALTIPQQAVVVRDGFSYCFQVQADARVAQVKITTGRRVGDAALGLVEVVDGLPQGAIVVASGAGFLNDGDTVKTVALATKPAIASSQSVKPGPAASAARAP
ncbi:MAG: efflux RND transporter periplasmic adaptor subunit [Rhodoferax sp.]|nr:efflux RND transporter periplasmic adaptor subunit [Rhodoferax sp.]